MTPRTVSIVRTNAALLILAGSFLMTSTGCKVIRERRAARAEEKRQKEIQSQSEWMQSQTIANETPSSTAPTTTTTKPHPTHTPHTTTPPTKPTTTTVVDQRPSQQQPSTNPTPAGEPAVDLEPTPRFAPKTREERSLAQAMQLRSSGDLSAALAQLERAIAFNPRFAPAFIEAGDIYMEMAQFDLAERQYAAAVKSEPRNFMAQYRHATVLHQLGQLDQSRRAYLRALSIRPADFNANLGASIVHLEMGKAEQALPYAQRAVRNDSSSGRARLQLGNVYAAIDQHENAVIEYQQAAELIDAPTAGLLLNMSESLNQLGRYAEMVGALEQLVRLEPSAIAYERLGSGLFRLKRYDDALAAFNSATDYDDKHYPALNGVAVCELNNYLWSNKADGPARQRAVTAMRASLRIERKQPKIVELLRRYSNPSNAERSGN